jgi:serine/threonine-protein kinase RsbW
LSQDGGQKVRKRYELCRAAELASLAEFRGLIDGACQEHPAIGTQTCYDLKLAIDEACTNIVTHGYAGMNPGSIILALEFQPHQVVVTLTDFGHPFELYEPPGPDLKALPDDGATGGFGLFFIYQTMDEILYRTAEDGNHLTFIKLLREQ